jgi:hypothetical protein
LEQITGRPVLGYRAPDFSIVRRTLWAFYALAEAGFQYDSSVVPVRLVRYGIPEWPSDPTWVRLDNGRRIWEVPLATFPWAGRNWPVGGGGYHRLLPGFATRYLAQRVMETSPFVFYCHPYEFDVHELSEIHIPLPLRVRLHQGLGRQWFEKRFRSFLQRFGGQRIQDLQASRSWSEIDLKQFDLQRPSATAPLTQTC